MASEYEIKSKKLADELAKPMPDSDVVYALKTTRPYWNTVDTDKIQRGYEKLNGNSLTAMLDKLVTGTKKGKDN